MLPLTIWMDAPSFYQNDLFKDLVATGDVDLQVIFARRLPNHRLQIGWKEEHRDYPNHTLRNSLGFWEAVRIAQSQEDRLHIVSGIWVEPAFAAALFGLGLNHSRFIIYSEAPDPLQRRSFAKRALRRIFGVWVAKRAAGLLSVSDLATAYYSSLGFREETIYPFGYFRAPHILQNPLRQSRNDSIGVIFVGQLIHRKGLDILLEAILPLFVEYPGLHLIIVGAGEEGDAIQDSVRAAGIQERVIFDGILPSDRVQARLALADLLVLPSRWDGWGLVVNEALSVGVPAIVSDSCGAAELIRSGKNGYVFRSGDAGDLRKRLRDFLSRRTDRTALRDEAAAMGKCISTDKVAPYLVDCLKHLNGSLSRRPIAPWKA